MIAESLAHYRIIKKLGRGGMGEVYLAQDTKLDRKVAIKVLTPEMIAKENSKKRLVREAQAAAKLDHPNICAIYDVDEADSHTFIVMQYVQGETLAAIMRRKVLRLAVAIDIAQQTAEGLAEAHAQGVIHRDIKPQNIIITPRGQVKILDFGLSKVLHKGSEVDNEAPTVSLLSTPGKVIGTMPYMSPEQVRGETLDESSDIFSLGVMFHEMVAGKHPFKGQSSQVTMSRILLAEPYTSDRLETLAPPDLQRVISKMLAKDKSERYRSAEDFILDLKRLPSSAPPDETQSLAAATKEHSVVTPQEKVPNPILAKVMAYKWVALAVLLAVVVTAVVMSRLLAADRLDSLAILPFTYASSDPQLMANPDRDYLSDGFTDSVINNLSQLPDLRIIARSSVFRYKGKNLDIQAVGRELNVRAVLVGQIKQEGDELTITTELMDVKDNRSLGIDTYKRKVADIHTVQLEIAKNIAEKLRWKLTGADKTHLAKTYTNSGEAYEAYLKGRYHWNKRTEEGFKQAAKFFKEATDKDPNYALAYSGLADCYTLESDYGFLAPTEGYRLAEAWTTLALKFDDSLAEAHTSLASIKAVKDWDWLGAENEYRRAIELNPNYPTAHHWYAAQLLVEGKLDEALVEINKAQQLDPLSLGINKDFAVIYLYRKDYDKALNQARKTLDIESNFHVMSTYIAQIYEFQQKYSEAVAELEKAHAIAPDDNEINFALGQAYAHSGRKDEALKISNQLNQPGKPSPLPKEAAYLYELLGEKDNAIATLQAAADDHYISVAEIKMDPRFAGLRTDARVVELLRKIGLQ
jgi:serine/threonine protein kinase/tetratricopeptide (TPR) repeat protein